MQRTLDAHSPYGELIGRTILSTDAEGRAIEVSYEAREEFTNRMGTVSGGMLSAMLDSVTGLAAMLVLPEELTAVHTTLRVEYLRSVRPGRVTGRARVISTGDREIQSHGELIDASGTTVARGEATLRILRQKES